MATLHETAYPRLKPDPTAKELEEIYTPSAAEIAFAKQLTTQPGPQLAVLIHLKLFQRLGYCSSTDNSALIRQRFCPFRQTVLARREPMQRFLAVDWPVAQISTVTGPVELAV